MLDAIQPYRSYNREYPSVCTRSSRDKKSLIQEISAIFDRNFIGIMVYTERVVDKLSVALGSLLFKIVTVTKNYTRKRNVSSLNGTSMFVIWIHSTFLLFSLINPSAIVRRLTYFRLLKQQEALTSHRSNRTNGAYNRLINDVDNNCNKSHLDRT